MMLRHRHLSSLLLCAALVLWAAMALAASTMVVYVVRPGDTVTGIAQKLGIEPVVIIVHNNLNEPYRLSPGQRLKVPNPRTSSNSTSTSLSRPAAKSSVSRPSPPRTSAPKPLVSKPSAAPSKSISSSSGTYTVKKGDTLAVIARNHGTTIEALAALNNLENPSSIYPGQTLITKGSGSSSQPAPYFIEKDSMGGGDKRSSSSSYSGPRHYAWPVKGKIIKEFSPTGYIKSWGIMIAAAEGTPVRAARSGQVTFSDNTIPGYGNMIMIDHGDNYYTVYAHNKSNLVGVNRRVKQGDQIALVGKRPQDPEHNLYFEIRNQKGEALDPERYLTK